MNPQSQAELLESLWAIFPAFRCQWTLENQGLEPWPSAALHSVYMSFLPFVSGTEPSAGQLSQLAALINGAVSAGGNSENAVSTCFLEHLGQGLLRRMRPLLSPEARRRLHA